ncbi:proS [Acrasis kona]|uniref:ProS n=1 Tax=Acrasis kona TaxID=1008807 RepID=A0AAW2ZNL3_9EUKA
MKVILSPATENIVAFLFNFLALLGINGIMEVKRRNNLLTTNERAEAFDESFAINNIPTNGPLVWLLKINVSHTNARAIMLFYSVLCCMVGIKVTSIRSTQNAMGFNQKERFLSLELYDRSYVGNSGNMVIYDASAPYPGIAEVAPGVIPNALDYCLGIYSTSRHLHIDTLRDGANTPSILFAPPPAGQADPIYFLRAVADNAFGNPKFYK